MLLRVTQHEKYFHAQFIAQFCWITVDCQQFAEFYMKKKSHIRIEVKVELVVECCWSQYNKISLSFDFVTLEQEEEKAKAEESRHRSEMEEKKKNGQLRFTFHYSLHFLFEFPHCLFFCCVFSSVCECGGHSKLTLKQKTCYEIIQHQNNIKYIKKIVRWLSERESYNYFSFIGAKIITFCINFISKTQLKVWYWVHFQLLSSDNTHITQLQTFIFPAFPAWLSCKTERE